MVISIIRVKYVVSTDAIKEPLWSRGLTCKHGFQEVVVNFYYNSMNVNHLCKNPQHNERTKHVVVKYHFIKDVTEIGLKALMKVHIDENSPDIETEAMIATKFQHCKRLVGIIK